MVETQLFSNLQDIKHDTIYGGISMKVEAVTDDEVRAG